MNHKDGNSVTLIEGANNFESDSPVIISDDSNSRSMVLRPKQLFPSNNTRNNSVVDNTCNSVAFSAYEYQSPMEKHLSTVLTDISLKEIEIEKTKSEIESMNPMDYTNGDTVAITCGRCHQGNHTKRRCVDPPCTTSISCGKIRFHKSELKVVENKKVHLKKLIHDKVSLGSECKKIRETIASTVKTFPQAVKTALINSNKKEYLTIHECKFVPLTTRISRDISILQKYYNGKIPNDIEQESSLFPTIIAEANKRFQVNSFTVEQKLEETLSSVHRRITVNSGSLSESNCITVDSSPEINTNQQTTTTVNIASPDSMTGHGMFPNNALNSPPTKLPKPSTNLSCHNSQLDDIVDNFLKLDSPSKEKSHDINKYPSGFKPSACTMHVPVETSATNINVSGSGCPQNRPCAHVLCKNSSSNSLSLPFITCRKSSDKVTPDVVRPPAPPHTIPVFTLHPIRSHIHMPLSHHYIVHTTSPSLRPKPH